MANVQMLPPLPIAPLVGSNGLKTSWDLGGVVMATPPGPIGRPARAASRRRSGRVIEVSRLLVPSGSIGSAIRNGSEAAWLHQTTGGQCSFPRVGFSRTKQRIS